jgi:hypothetical protein
MGGNNLRKRIRTLERRITEHKAKINEEVARWQPNEGVIRHWHVELRAFQGSLLRARKRLGGRW